MELANHLRTTSSYLLGFGEDLVTQNIAACVSRIKDEKIKKMILVQVEALTINE